MKEAQLQWTAFVSVRRNVLSADHVLNVTPQDLFGLVLRNQMFLCLLAGILGVSVTASDRRSGLTAFRVAHSGRRWSLVSGVWLYGALLAASVGGVGVTLLYHFAWGVVSGCLSDRYWLQIALLENAPISMWPALAASLLFLLVGVLVHLHRVRRGPA